MSSGARETSCSLYIVVSGHLWSVLDGWYCHGIICLAIITVFLVKEAKENICQLGSQNASSANVSVYRKTNITSACWLIQSVVHLTHVYTCLSVGIDTHAYRFLRKAEVLDPLESQLQAVVSHQYRCWIHEFRSYVRAAHILSHLAMAPAQGKESQGEISLIPLACGLGWGCLVGMARGCLDY